MPATAVRERPILFNGEMVRAILDGRKTVTRRVVGLDTLRRSETPSYDWTWRGQAPVRSIAQQQRSPRGCWQDLRHADFMRLCPYGQPGDRLWVRETFRVEGEGEDERAIYRADCGGEDCEHDARTKWKPSIFMPRWASRLTLEITDVRVERLQDIGRDGRKAADVLAEGISEQSIDRERKWFHPDDAPALAFSRLWDSINAKSHPWNANPWTWVVSFKRA